MDIRFFESPTEFRDWLRASHDTATELVVGFHKKATGRPSLTWPESVDQALCFGWIDGIRKSIDAEAYSIRFTPRKPDSTWSNINIKRVGELAALGLMRPAGIAAFDRRKDAKSGIYAYERGEPPQLSEDALREFQMNEAAWTYFESQPPWYRRTASGWVMSAKRDETRRRRLATLIGDSEAGRPIAPLSYGKTRTLE